MKNPLDIIENRLQALIESSFLLIPGNVTKPSLARQFTEALSNHLISDGNDGLLTSNLFIMHVDPLTFGKWREIEEELCILLEESARDAGVTFSDPPEIQIVVDPSLGEGEVKIEATDPSQKTGYTAVIYTGEESTAEKSGSPDTIGGYLIVNGGDMFCIQRTVLNIGRNPENHLVINDQRVSRSHCQLRLVHQHYVLFDLNSSGGTYVNNIRVNRQVLTTGDIISLAGVQLIYGEDPHLQSQNTGRILPEPIDRITPRDPTK